MLPDKAYFLNFSNFKTFCDKVWKEDTLDFTLLEPITIYQFKFIGRMFEANNHIFPKNMPRNSLCHITEGTHFTFYINESTMLPLLRPQFPIEHFVSLTLMGNQNFSRVDPTIEILFTFHHVKKLAMHHITFSDMITAALSTLTFKNIFLYDCCASFGLQFELAKAIMRSKKWMQSISIHNKGVYRSIDDTIEHLLTYLYKFRKLQVLIITMPYKPSTITRISRIGFPKSLKL